MPNLWSALSKIGLAEEIKEPQKAPPGLPFNHGSSKAAVSPPRAEPASSSIDPAIISKLDGDSKAQLVRALEAQAFPAIEELNNVLGPLKEVIADETVRYNTALSILGKKFPMMKLLEDYDRGLGVLDETQRKFQTALDEQLEKRVGAKIRSVQTIDADIQRLEDQKAVIEGQLISMRAAREKENSGVAKEQAQLDLTRERFDLAHREIRGNLEQERQKVARFGGNSK